ncbi:hypothetical protein [Enterocloster asparagiformis]|uniref:hypothetical protein n=1 Tax=Enterocloster asparagiformis TaxID=333367 RepID=UPI002ED22950
MINKFCKTPLWEATMTLAATAEGRIPAETVIRDARLVNVCTGEIMEHTDVAIAQGRIALVGDGSHCIGPDTRVIELRPVHSAGIFGRPHPCGVFHDGRGGVCQGGDPPRHRGHLYGPPRDLQRAGAGGR